MRARCVLNFKWLNRNAARFAAAKVFLSTLQGLGKELSFWVYGTVGIVEAHGEQCEGLYYLLTISNILISENSPMKFSARHKEAGAKLGGG
jgi:hypothetical protein